MIFVSSVIVLFQVRGIAGGIYLHSFNIFIFIKIFVRIYSNASSEIITTIPFAGFD